MNQNLVDVNYTVFINEKLTGKIERLDETHKMRYFSLPELQCYWHSKFLDCGTLGWMTNSVPNSSIWAAFQKLKRI